MHMFRGDYVACEAHVLPGLVFLKVPVVPWHTRLEHALFLLTSAVDVRWAAHQPPRTQGKHEASREMDARAAHKGCMCMCTSGEKRLGKLPVGAGQRGTVQPKR